MRPADRDEVPCPGSWTPVVDLTIRDSTLAVSRVELRTARDCGAEVVPWASLHGTRHVLRSGILPGRLPAQSAPVLAPRRPGQECDVKVFCRAFLRISQVSIGGMQMAFLSSLPTGRSAHPGRSSRNHFQASLEQSSQTSSARICSCHRPKRGMTPARAPETGSLQLAPRDATQQAGMRPPTSATLDLEKAENMRDGRYTLRVPPRY